MPGHIIFPHPSTADPDGLLAIGGNLEVNTLLAAYSQGIFPWYNDDSPILWWSPDPRMVLFPGKLKVSSSLGQKIRKKVFEVKLDANFEKVINYCATLERKGQQGTWITEDMKQAYINLHKAGYAHSVETYYNGSLAGGLYGVSIGKAFFGESMFRLVSDASKVALYYLVKVLKNNDYLIIDVQQSTRHLKSLGACEITRAQFLKILEKAVNLKGIEGIWHNSLIPDHP
ncbi:MAG: leucyl/phenylalanyl-tRNA--protein transferase [Bacteroidales bacterium]|nr:leucyl/phenylalanyl-tRNA--protein transferase [Bacteroidales bacterium]